MLCLCYAGRYQLGQKTTIVDCVSNRPVPCDLYTSFCRTLTKGKTEQSSSRDVNASADVSTTAISHGTVSGKVGPKLQLRKEDQSGQSFDESSDFVFAFRLKKITVDRKTKEAIAKDMRKGARLGLNDRIWLTGSRTGLEPVNHILFVVFY